MSISVGKESNIFSALTKEGKKVIVKIYRLETCDFGRMYNYIRGDPRFVNLKKKRREGAAPSAPPSMGGEKEGKENFISNYQALDPHLMGIFCASLFQGFDSSGVLVFVL